MSRCQKGEYRLLCSQTHQNINKRMYILRCILILSVLCITLVSATNKALLYYPPGHHYSISCQRYHVSTFNRTFDIDYHYIDKNTTAVRISGIYRNVCSNDKSCWFGIQTGWTSAVIVRLIIEEPFVVGTFTVQSSFLLVGGFKKPVNGTLVVDFQGLVDVSREQFNIYSNRSGCYDLNNYIFHRASFANLYGITIPFILQLVTVVWLIVSTLFVLCLRNSNMIKRRMGTGIVGNMSMITVAMLFFMKSVILTARNRRTLIYLDSSDSHHLVSIVVITNLVITQICLSAYCFRVFRYMYLKAIYRWIFKIKNYTKFTKILLSKWLFITVFYLIAILVHIVLVVVVVVSQTKKPVVFVTGVIRWLSIATAAVPFLIDGVINIPKLRKGIKYFFIHDDPLLYRLEFCIGIVICILGFIVPWSLTFATKSAAKLVSRWYGMYGDVIVICGLQFMVGNGFAACVEFYRYIRNRITKKKYLTLETLTIEFEDQLRDGTFRNLFEQYAMNEMSFENMKAWNSLSTYKQLGEVSQPEYKDLYRAYVSSTSELQVNLAAKTVRILKEVYDHCSDNDDPIPFEQIQEFYRDVIRNLVDTYSRFVNTSEYKLYSSMNTMLQNEYNVNVALQERLLDPSM
jgi:hypothetical protein